MQAVDLSEALRRILERGQGTERTEFVATDLANGRVVAEDIAAPVSLPPFRSSAMDGYACRAADLVHGTVLSLNGESLAGHPYQGDLINGQCIRITTGAAVPDCADTVVIQENCVAEAASVTLLEAPATGANIRVVGHDVAAGATVVRKGQRLNPLDLGWLAACGVTGVNAFMLPRVAVFSTGDELMLPGTELNDGQIYDSNRVAVSALLEALPAVVTDLGILPDDPASISQALSSAAGNHELLLTSGGVSVGDADYVREVVARLGAIELWKMNLKPGKPLAFGHVQNTLFLGLPGNPVSTIATFLLIARPLILKLSGSESAPPRRQMARLSSSIRHSPGREEYQRGRLEHRGGEDWVAATGGPELKQVVYLQRGRLLDQSP